MRMYVDLRVKPRSLDELRGILRVARRLGYTAVAVEAEHVGPAEARRLGEEAGVKVYTRVTVRAATRREARLALDSAPKADIVALAPTGLDAARYAAVNKRVHLVRVEPGMERIVDASEARLLWEKGWGAIEVSLREALRGNWRYLSVLRRAYAFDADTVLVSDAREAVDLWSPYHVRGVLRALGLPPSMADVWLGSSPSRLLGAALR